jgi:hypothetical protein
MKPKYKHNNNITYSCKYHIVWCLKYRRKVLLEGVDVRLKEILALVAIELNSKLIGVEVMARSRSGFGRVRSSIWNYQACSVHEGALLSISPSGIPWVKKSVAYTWD